VSIIQLKRYKHIFQDDKRFDLQSIARCRSLRDIDTNFTAKQFGYPSCEDYYNDASLDAKIQDIKIPTLFLNAADDMFSPERGAIFFQSIFLLLLSVLFEYQFIFNF
jgi:predicted alpha/beta-fold hydrolase